MITKIREDVAALAAGAAVFLASGLITDNIAVWISTGIGAVTAALATFTVKKAKTGTAGVQTSLAAHDVSLAVHSARLAGLTERVTALESPEAASCTCAKPAPGATKTHPVKKAATKKPRTT